jgi:hypothetical protein
MDHGLKKDFSQADRSAFPGVSPGRWPLPFQPLFVGQLIRLLRCFTDPVNYPVMFSAEPTDIFHVLFAVTVVVMSFRL